MSKMRRSRAELLQGAPPIGIWPTVSDTVLQGKKLELFKNRSTAIRMYADGYLVNEIESATGIRRNDLARLASRCLEPAFDGRIMGFRALIPNLPMRGYSRVAEFKRKLPEAQGGMAGAFQQILDRYPEIKEELIARIKKRNSPTLNVHEKRIRAKTLQNILIKSLEKKGLPPTSWPFNTKHRGLRTIQRFLNEQLDESFSRSVTTREEQAAVAHLAVGTGYERLLRFEEPYDCVELDAYSINAFFSAEFETPEGTTVNVQLERIWLLALIESVSSAELAWTIVYRSEVGADDVLRVIRKAINPPERIELTIPGLEYPAKGGQPNEVFPECQGAVWGALMLDGALANLSQAVHSRARRTLGFSINWGPVAHFERRPNIERLFANIASEIFARLPTTTGSNPANGRAKNAEQDAVRYKIVADEVEQLVAVHMAQYNATPNEGSSYNSPLDVLRFYLQEQADHFVVRHLPVRAGGAAVALPLILVRTVRGGRSSGRRPYVQIDGARYTNPVLAQTSGLIGRKLVIEIDEEDMRFCIAFLKNGAELGQLKAGGRWHLTKHSRKTRKIINSLVSKKILVITSMQDPVIVYFDYLSTEKRKGRRTKDRPLTPRNATEATRVAKESGLPMKIVQGRESDPAHGSTIDELIESRPAALAGPVKDLYELLRQRGRSTK